MALRTGGLAAGLALGRVDLAGARGHHEALAVEERGRLDEAGRHRVLCPVARHLRLERVGLLAPGRVAVEALDRAERERAQVGVRGEVGVGALPGEPPRAAL